MAKGTIEFHGSDELLAELRRRLGNGVARLENKALRAAGEPIAQAMKSHVKTSDREEGPHLKDEIKVSKVMRKEGNVYVLIGAGKGTGWRSHFLEFGTVKMSARPFIEPGYREAKPQALAIMADEFRKGLKE